MLFIERDNQTKQLRELIGLGMRSNCMIDGSNFLL